MKGTMALLMLAASGMATVVGWNSDKSTVVSGTTQPATATSADRAAGTSATEQPAIQRQQHDQANAMAAQMRERAKKGQH